MQGFLPIILLSTLLMGSSFPSAAVLLQGGADPLSLVAVRFLVAAAAASIFALLFFRATLHRVEWVPSLVIGFFQTFGVMAPVHVALTTEAPAVVAAIVFSNVLMVAGVEVVMGHRKASLLLIVSLGLGFLGLLATTMSWALLFSRGDTPPAGLFLSLVAAVSWCMATLLSKRMDVSATPQFNAQQLVVGAVLLVVFASMTNGTEIWSPQSTSQWLWLLWLAIPASVISFGLWFAALRLKSATEASAWLSAVPCFAALISYTVLGSTLTLAQGLGMLLVAIGLLVQARAP